jgi:hypothetical protein
MQSKLPAITYSYASSEEEITACRDLRFYVVVCFVGWVSHLDFAKLEHNESTTENEKNNRALQGINVTFQFIWFFSVGSFAFIVRNQDCGITICNLMFNVCVRKLGRCKMQREDINYMIVMIPYLCHHHSLLLTTSLSCSTHQSRRRKRISSTHQSRSIKWNQHWLLASQLLRGATNDS